MSSAVALHLLRVAKPSAVLHRDGLWSRSQAGPPFGEFMYVLVAMFLFLFVNNVAFL